MIVAINFANEKFRSTQKFNTKMAKKFGADKTIEYSPEDIDKEFTEKNKEIWSNPRGCGFWIWKPYIIKKTFQTMEIGDYLLYSDSGSCLVDRIEILIDAMEQEKTDIMIYCLHSIEKKYSKRDAFILLDCDTSQYTDTPQRCASYMIFKKTERSELFVSQWLEIMQDKRIVTNDNNVMGLPNYEGFVENRHDQTVLSLLAKKWEINVFRDPDKCGLDMKYPEDVLKRSPYGQVFDAHRYRYMPNSYFVYKYVPRKYFEKAYNFCNRKKI